MARQRSAIQKKYQFHLFRMMKPPLTLCVRVNQARPRSLVDAAMVMAAFNRDFGTSVPPQLLETLLGLSHRATFLKVSSGWAWGTLFECGSGKESITSKTGTCWGKVVSLSWSSFDRSLISVLFNTCFGWGMRKRGALVFKMAQSTNLLDNFVTIWAVSLTHRCANLEQCGAATLTVPYSSATEASSHPNAMNLHPRSAHLSVTKLHRFLFLPVMRLISILVPLGCHVLWLHPPISWLWFVWAALCVGWLPPAGTLDLSVTELWPHTVWNVATTL